MLRPANPDIPAFLANGGECGRLIAAREWSETLGPVERWPQSLRTATAIILSSTVPMVMLWGEDGIMIYNDAYSAFASGRHPELLGSKVREGWPEVADFNDRVMRTGLAGETLQFRDQELTLHRKGHPEQVWMDLDYSPVPGDDGRPTGVLAVVVETTQRHRAEQKLREREKRLRFFDQLSEAIRTMTRPEEVMACTAKLVGRQMGASVVAFADIGADEDVMNIRGDWSAEGSASIVGTYSLNAFGPTANEALRVGRPFITCDTLSELGPVEGKALLDLGLGATVCMPFFRDGRLAALMAVHQKEPRYWTEAELALISEAVDRSWPHVERVRDTAVTRESEERLRLVIDGATDYAIFTIDPERRITSWSIGAENVFGYSAADAIGRDGDELWTPEDRAAGQPQQEVDTARTQGCASNERWHLRSDGSRRFLNGSAHPLPLDAAGRERGFIKIARDETDRRAAEAALRDASELARKEAAERTAILGQLAEGVIVTDPQGRITFVNDAAERLHGVKLLGVAPDQYSQTYHLLKEDGSPHPPLELPLARAILKGETVLDARWRICRPDGTTVLAVGNAQPLLDSEGQKVGAVLTIRDDTRRMAAQIALERSEDRLRTVLDAVPAAVWITDNPDAKIIEGNAFSRSLLRVGDGANMSLSADEAERPGGFRVYDERGRELAPDELPVQRAARGEIVRDFRETIQFDDGKVSHLFGNAKPLLDPDGKVSGSVAAFVDITQLKRAELHQRLLIDELSHRAKNLLAIIQSVAQQSFKGARDPAEMLRSFEGRLGALAAAHGILTREKWEAAPIRRIMCDTISAVKADDDRLKLNGPDLMVPPKTGVSLAMAIHELATNALKYGSFSDDKGRVTVTWGVEDGRLKLEWRETGGPPVTVPSRRGFGSRMIERGLASELGGQVEIEFRPEGVVCTVDAPMPEAV